MTNEIDLKFNLAAILEDEGLTKYRIHKVTGIRPNTMTNYYNGNVNKIDIENVGLIINALRSETGKQYGISDIIIEVPKSERTESNI